MRIIFRAALIALMLTPVGATAQDYEKGLAAAQTGDYSMALKEWRPLAETGHSDAQYSLGVIYANGLGVAQDYTEAAKWYQLAAEQGHADGQYNLGQRYAKGQGAPQNYTQAAKWFHLAAAQGHTPAQYNLGVIYANGLGVAQDYVTAHMWFNVSSADSSESRIMESKMSPDQIAEAQRRASVCMASGYKDCD